MLTVVLEENGDYHQKKRTLRSLELQETKEYRVVSCREKERKDCLLALPEGPEEYCLLLRAGMTLPPHALKALQAGIEQYHAHWYYGDEHIRDWKDREIGYEEKAKPAFGLYGFLSCLYTGCAVVFSNRRLRQAVQELAPEEPEREYRMFLLRMTVEMAKKQDGCHLEAPLLCRERLLELTQDQEERLAQWLNELLRHRKRPLLAAPDGREGFCRLYRTLSIEPTCSLIIIADDPAQDAFWETMYAQSAAGWQVIVSSRGSSFGEKWNRGAQRAEGSVLFFLQAGCQMPPAYRQKELAEWAMLPDVGMVSPRLLDAAGDLLYGGAARSGRGFCRSLSYWDGECAGYTKGIREISVPAWQCFAVKKERWQQAGGFSEANLSPEFGAADFSLRLAALGYTGLYEGQVAVYCPEVRREEEKRGLLYMLKTWGAAWAADPYYTAAMCRKVLKGKETRLFLPEHPWEDAGQGKTLLLVTHELSMTGAPVVLYYAAQVLRQAGYRLLLLSPRDGVLRQRFLEEKIPVWLDGDLYGAGAWASYAGEFALLFVNTVVPFSCILQTGRTPVPVLWWIHDAKKGYESYLQRVLPQTMGDRVHIYCVSAYAREVLGRYRPQYRANLLLYGLPDYAALPRGDWPLAEEREACPVQRPAGRKQIFLTVGTLEPRKGQDILLKAIENLTPEEREAAIFYFIGRTKTNGCMRPLQAMMERYPDTVRWIPFLDREAMMDAYAQASAVLCCSRDDPMPVFMAETMMMAGVCICSEHTGTASQIRPGENGFLYAGDSPEALAACISHVLRHPEEMDTIRRAARETYEKYYTLPVFREHLMAAVEKAMGESGE